VNKSSANPFTDGGGVPWFRQRAGSPLAQSSQPPRTKIRKIITVVMALFVATFFMGALPAPASAFNVHLQNNIPDHWNSRSTSTGNPAVRYCLVGSFGSTPATIKSTIRSAIGRWNALADSWNIDFRFVEHTPIGTPGCQLVVAWDTDGGDYIMQAGYLTQADGNGGLKIWAGTININAQHAGGFWWYTSTQNCNGGVLGNCKSDAYTAIAHEAGHILGLYHPGYPGDNLGSCWSGCDGDGCQAGEGFAFLNDEAACDSIGERVMYWSAADGFRREMTADEGNGLLYIYGKE
jgi:hypothetical protein